MVHFAFLDSAGQEIASHDESIRGSSALSALYAAKARNYIDMVRIDKTSVATVVVSDGSFKIIIEGNALRGDNLS